MEPLSKNRAYYLLRRRWMYELLMITSFVLSYLSKPYLETFVSGFTENKTMLFVGTWLLVYAIGMYIIPEILFLLTNKLLKTQN